MQKLKKDGTPKMSGGKRKGSGPKRGPHKKVVSFRVKPKLIPAVKKAVKEVTEKN